MSTYPSANRSQEKVQRLVAGILLLGWLVLGNGSLGIASETHSPLGIQRDRISGVLTQVPLRMILDQLQEKLAINYVAPREELDKPVSVNLTGEPVSNALSKILASWDYALQVDQQGTVHQIFVVAKMEPTAIEENAITTFESKKAIFSGKIMSSEPILSTPRAVVSLPEVDVIQHPEENALVTPMFVERPHSLEPMVIQSPQGKSMNIQPSSNFMEVIPASGYPPMNILPASEDAQRESVEGYN